MKERISVRDLYDAVVAAFPEVRHNPYSFVTDIVDSLENDGLGSVWMRRKLLDEGLELSLSREWPLNDLITGSQHYLLCRGVPEKDANAYKDSTHSFFE